MHIYMGWQAHVETFCVIVDQCASGLQMEATATSNLVVWLDGVEQPMSPNADSLLVTDTFTVPAETQVVAMKCDDSSDSYSGFCMASFGNGGATDGTWRCSADPEAGWTAVGFDDSAWDYGLEVMANEDYGGGVPNIPNDVFWIMAVGYQQTSYCRKDLRKSLVVTLAEIEYNTCILIRKPLYCDISSKYEGDHMYVGCLLLTQTKYMYTS